MQHAVGGFRARPKWNQDVADIAMALALATLAIVVAGFPALPNAFGAVTTTPLTPVGAVLILAQTLPLAVRRRQPALVLLLGGVSMVVDSWLGNPETGGSFGVLVALYTVAAHSDRRTSTISAIATALGVLISFTNYAGRDPHMANQLLGVYISYSATWLLGTFVQGRRLDIRAQRERTARLVQEREERARLAVAEERARIARELHDVVAHHVSVMVVQAGAARRVAASDPASARTAIAAVESAGRTALSEMRRMLEVLHADEPDLEPEPSLANVERLVDRVRGAGLPVELHVEGERPDLPAGTDLAAYRIVQEALTNVVKHAGQATASVRITYGPTLLVVEVADDGRGAAANLGSGSGGRGLVGMRERALLYGGTVEAGPRPAGGYAVRATFQLEPPASAPERPEASAAPSRAYRRRPGDAGSSEAPLDARFRPTDEVFEDPTTLARVRVWLDAVSGERRYRADDAGQAVEA